MLSCSSIESDTIAAVATPPGEGGVAVIRVSGPHALDAALALVPANRFDSPALPRTAHYVRFRHPKTGSPLDDGLLLLFPAPRSYTGENTAELHIHGSPVMVRRILEALRDLGVRPAEPGEFTKRAFLNGKMNLTQAEAVMDLIHARSERAARMASAQLDNALGSRLQELYDRIVAATADVEAMLDFPDDELPPTVPADIVRRLVSERDGMDDLLKTAENGQILREGLVAAIVGPPNAGKSTLMNRLAGRERSIVSSLPGTTRDTVEDTVTVQGVPVCLVDTAGLRDARSPVEREGIRRARKEIDRADWIFLVLDGSHPATEAERALAASVPPEKTIVFLNKSDLGLRQSPADYPGLNVHAVSLVDPASAETVFRILSDALPTGAQGENGGNLAISQRHRDGLLTARGHLQEAIGLLETAREEDFLPAANALHLAMEELARIWGKDAPEDLLDRIFSRFCVGK